jgi:hypothetical protein
MTAIRFVGVDIPEGGFDPAGGHRENPQVARNALNSRIPTGQIGLRNPEC